jgi:hypothetical protein
MNDDELRRQVERSARATYRWATLQMWASGCALFAYVLPIIAAIVVGLIVYLATR